MKVGQKVKARFMTLPNLDVGNDRSFENTYPIRDGVVTYIHPQWRYITVTADAGYGVVSESFSPMELKNAMEGKSGKRKR